MFRFAWPWLGLLVLLPLVARFLWPSARRASPADQQPVLLHPALTRLDGAFGAVAPGLPAGQSMQLLLRSLLWGMLVLAMMQPQWLQQHKRVISRGYDLMLAIDASRSMEALDFTVDGQRVTRMAVVKGVAGRFIDQRQGDRIGLVLFGDSAFVQSPLTLDAGAARAMLDNVVTRMAGDGTAIGDAIGLAVKKLRERPEGSRVLILVTDGENTAGTLPPVEAARLAAQYHIRIYTIGVGSKGLVPFMENGEMTMTRMEIDEDLLREISARTGGAYFRATDTQALEKIYRDINELERTEAETRSVMVPEPLYRWPLALALVVLLALALLSRRVRA